MNKYSDSRKTLALKFIMLLYNIKIPEIAFATNFSDTYIRKHINGTRYNRAIDEYIFNIMTQDEF